MEYRHAPVVSQTGPNFAVPVANDGYAWWYVDALSDCGRHGLTMIAMLGCVFSPWYAAARRRGSTDPLEHSALNVALYGESGHRWALTERARRDVARDAGSLTIGPSHLLWNGNRLDLTINEITSPWPSRLRGKVTLHPEFLLSQAYAIDRLGEHLWVPTAPRCRIEVEFTQPALRWSGTAYLDANQGTNPLESAFDSWNWSRAANDSASRIFYDTRWLDEPTTGRMISLLIDRQGKVEERVPPPRHALPTTAWGIRRETRCDANANASVLKTLESGPFYARSLVQTRADGHDWTAFHESVSLRRYAARWVQTLLPVKLPRHPLR